MLNKKQLNKLPTPRLLQLYRKNFKKMKSAYAYVTDYGVMPEALNNDTEEVRYCIELDRYCDEMKKILNTRENIQ